jgi:hypothetical protein
LWLDVFAEEWIVDLAWEDADLLSLTLTELVTCPNDRDEIREGDETATADK